MYEWLHSAHLLLVKGGRELGTCLGAGRHKVCDSPGMQLPVSVPRARKYHDGAWSFGPEKPQFMPGSAELAALGTTKAAQRLLP